MQFQVLRRYELSAIHPDGGRCTPCCREDMGRRTQARRPGIIRHQEDGTDLQGGEVQQAVGAQQAFVHNSIAAQASAHTEPRAQDDTELELLWLHLTMRQLHLASTYTPNSAKAGGVMCGVGSPGGGSRQRPAVTASSCGVPSCV
jgi:hypothetical protein